MGLDELIQSPLYSRSCQNALQIVERLATAGDRRDRVHSISAIAAESGMDVPTVTQLIHFLRLAGLVVQERPSGSICLSRRAEEISLLEVIRATDAGGFLHRCLMGLAECSDSAPCPVHTVWKNTRAEIENHLQTQTVADLVRALAQKRELRQSGGPRRRTLERADRERVSR